MKPAAVVIALLTLLCAVPAQAYVIYDTEASFQTAISGLGVFTEGFENTSDWPSTGVQSNTLNYGGNTLTWEGETSEGPANLVGHDTPEGVAHTGERGLYISGSTIWESVEGSLESGELYGFGFWIRPHPTISADGFSVQLDGQKIDLGGLSPFQGDEYQFVGILAEAGEFFADFLIKSSEGSESDPQNIWLDDFTFLTQNPNPNTEIPVPAALWLLGSGLLGLIGLRRRSLR